MFQCVNAVQKSLQDLQGVERYDIDLEKKRVTITGKSTPFPSPIPCITLSLYSNSTV